MYKSSPCIGSMKKKLISPTCNSLHRDVGLVTVSKLGSTVVAGLESQSKEVPLLADLVRRCGQERWILKGC